MNLKKLLGEILACTLLALMMFWLILAWLEQSYEEQARIVEAHKAFERLNHKE